MPVAPMHYSWRLAVPLGLVRSAPWQTMERISLPVSAACAPMQGLAHSLRQALGSHSRRHLAKQRALARRRLEHQHSLADLAAQRSPAVLGHLPRLLGSNHSSRHSSRALALGALGQRRAGARPLGSLQPRPLAVAAAAASHGARLQAAAQRAARLERPHLPPVLLGHSLAQALGQRQQARPLGRRSAAAVARHRLGSQPAAARPAAVPWEAARQHLPAVLQQQAARRQALALQRAGMAAARRLRGRPSDLSAEGSLRPRPLWRHAADWCNICIERSAVPSNMFEQCGGGVGPKSAHPATQAALKQHPQARPPTRGARVWGFRPLWRMLQRAHVLFFRCPISSTLFACYCGWHHFKGPSISRRIITREREAYQGHRHVLDGGPCRQAAPQG